MLAITNATYLNEYKILIHFNNGRSGEVDLKNLILNDHRPIFNQLKDKTLFMNFKVEYDTLVWPNELDIAPEFLYFETFKDDPNLKPQFKEWGYIH